MPLPDEIEALFSGETPSVVVKVLLDYVEEARRALQDLCQCYTEVCQSLTLIHNENVSLHRKFEDLRMELSAVRLGISPLDSQPTGLIDSAAVRHAVEQSIGRTREREWRQWNECLPYPPRKYNPKINRRNQ